MLTVTSNADSIRHDLKLFHNRANILKVPKELVNTALKWVIDRAQAQLGFRNCPISSKMDQTLNSRLSNMFNTLYSSKQKSELNSIIIESMTLTPLPLEAQSKESFDPSVNGYLKNLASQLVQDQKKEQLCFPAIERSKRGVEDFCHSPSKKRRENVAQRGINPIQQASQKIDKLTSKEMEDLKQLDFLKEILKNKDLYSAIENKQIPVDEIKSLTSEERKALIKLFTFNETHITRKPNIISFFSPKRTISLKEAVLIPSFLWNLPLLTGLIISDDDVKNLNECGTERLAELNNWKNITFFMRQTVNVPRKISFADLKNLTLREMNELNERLDTRCTYIKKLNGIKWTAQAVLALPPEALTNEERIARLRVPRGLRGSYEEIEA